MAEHSSDSDEDWDNLDDWGGSTPTMEGVVAPALRETAISPTSSWNDDDEPWPVRGPAETSRGVGAPRSAPGVSWDEAVAGGQEDMSGDGPGWHARPPRPPLEGVVSPRLGADRQVDETFAWAPADTWEPAEPARRGLGRPRTEAQRLDELRRAAGDLVGDMGWADDAQGWVVQDHRGTPPPAEGVVAAGLAGRGVARTFDVGEGEMEEDALELEASAARGTGIARTESERLDMVRAEEGEREDDWARGRGFDTTELQRMIPEVEGVLGEGPREDGAFAETFGWEGELGEEWGPEERIVPPGRGAGAPVPPTVRREQGRLPMTAYELELLQAMVRQHIYRVMEERMNAYYFLNIYFPFMQRW